MKRREAANWQSSYTRQLAEIIHERIMSHVPEEIWVLIISEVYCLEKSGSTIGALNSVNKQWNRIIYQNINAISYVNMTKIQPVLDRFTQLKKLELKYFSGPVKIPPLKKLEQLIISDKEMVMGWGVKKSYCHSFLPIFNSLNSLDFPVLKKIRLDFSYYSDAGAGPLTTLPECMKTQIGFRSDFC